MPSVDDDLTAPFLDRYVAALKRLHVDTSCSVIDQDGQWGAVPALVTLPAQRGSPAAAPTLTALTCHHCGTVRLIDPTHLF
jgi:hypothetical protein